MSGRLLVTPESVVEAVKNPVETFVDVNDDDVVVNDDVVVPILDE